MKKLLLIVILSLTLQINLLHAEYVDPNPIIITYKDRIYGDFDTPVGNAFYGDLKSRCNLTKGEVKRYLQIKMYNVAIAFRDYKPVEETLYKHHGDQPQVQTELEYVYNKHDMYPSNIFDDTLLIRLDSIIKKEQEDSMNKLQESMQTTSCKVIKTMAKNLSKKASLQ